MINDLLLRTGKERLNWFEQNHTIINTVEGLKIALEGFPKKFAFDTETTGVRYYQLNIIGISFWDGKNNPFYAQFNFKDKYYTEERDPENKRKKIKVWHDYEKTDAIDLEEALPILKETFDGAETICANGKFDIKVMAKYDIWNFKTTKLIEDTQIQVYLLDSSKPQGLKPNVKKYVGYEMGSYEDTVLATKKAGELNINWNLVDWQVYGRYGALDAFSTLMLNMILRPLLKSVGLQRNPALESVHVDKCYYEIEIPLVVVTASMEIHGVHINKAHLKKIEKSIDKEITQREKNIFAQVGLKFNINSGKQVAEVLFDKLKYPVIGKTASGARATDAKTLSELAYRGHTLADEILAYGGS